MKKLLLLGSVAGPCPPKKAGGTERVAYVQAKELAKHGVEIILIGGVGTKANFSEQLKRDEGSEDLLAKIEIIEIGGKTQLGNSSDSIKDDPSQIEASRKLRVEMVSLSEVQKVMVERQGEYNLILNNMRGEAVLLPLAKLLKKELVNVMHLNIFPELARVFARYQTKLITISNSQREEFSDLSYLSTIYNPVNVKAFEYNSSPKDYALMLSTIGYHKNQKDAILACQKAGIKLILGGKIRDQEYFEQEIKPHIGKDVEYVGEIGFEEKLKLYQEAKVFLFTITWKEPFGLVLIESLACGTPVIAYPHGGPSEILRNGLTGFLVNSVDEMAEKIRLVDQIKRSDCREDVEKRFSDEVIGQQYYDTLKPLL